MKMRLVHAWFVRSPWPPGVLLLVLALAVRVPRLSDQLEPDEAKTLDQHIQQSPWTIVREFGTARNHPLYSLLAHFFWRVRPTIVAIRLPALFAGVAAVMVLWFWLRRLTGPVPAAWAAAALAISPPQALYSARARGYSMLVLGAIVTSWLLLRSIEHGRRRDWLGYAVSLVLVVYAHLWGLFLLVGHGAFVLAVCGREQHLVGFSLKKPGRQTFASFAQAAFGSLGLIGLLYAPMMPGIVAMLSEGREGPFWPELGSALFWNLDFGLPEASLALGVFLALVVLVSVIDAAMFRDPVAWLGGLPILTTLALVCLVQPANFYPRFLLFLLPFVVILVAGLLRSFPRFDCGPSNARSWCARPTVLSGILAVLAAVLLAVSVGMLIVGSVTGTWERIADWYAGFAWVALVGWIASELSGGVSQRLKKGFRLASTVTMVVVFVDLVPVLIDLDLVAIQPTRAIRSAMVLGCGLALIAWTIVQMNAPATGREVDRCLPSQSSS